jgi:penicillin-binding protein 2
MAADTPAGHAGRLRLFRLAVVAAFLLLGARLWQLQIVRGNELRRQARANTVAVRETEPDRGVIYDAAGRQVARNSPRFSVSIVPAALPREPVELQRVLRRVSTLLELPLSPVLGPADGSRPAPGGEPGSGLPPEMRLSFPGVWSLLPVDQRGRLIRTWSPAIIARNVPREIAFALMEAASDLPGVIVGESAVREYPAGPSLAHVLGFTGSIPESEVGRYRDEGYQIYDTVGRSGLEATYEAQLRGRKGHDQVVVDAMGQTLGVAESLEPPEPGHSLVLTIDLELQQAAEAALRRRLEALGARSGAVVALDPRNGAVQALVTWPSYDDNLFATGAKPEVYEQLISDPNLPLVNRAISGQYPPGSTFKIITASAALQEGIVGPKSRISCPGVITLFNQYDRSIPYPFFCWQRRGHGALAISDALAQSCDVFFYEVSGGYHENGANQDGLGSERLAAYARAFGLGQPTGIELLGEEDGRVPTAKWLAETTGEFWGTGETYNTGIGQGKTLVTPLQMASATAIIANGGTLFRPHLVERVVAADGTVVAQPGGVIGQLPVAAEWLAQVRAGLRGAVRHGTAQASWSQLPTAVAVAGKTGTAEFCDTVRFEDGTLDCRRDRDGHYLTHAWFVAFAPADAPEIALAVLVDGSGLDHIIEGSREAAPVAGDVLRAYFKLPARQPTATPCDSCPPPAAAAPSAAPSGP